MMKILRDYWLIITLSLLTNICLLFAINYSIGSKISEELIPYNLSENYIELARNEQTIEQTKEIIDFNKYDNLVVIAELGDSRSVGLLDLQMKFYNQATKATAPSVYRYFSKKDYMSHAKVGILINSCDPLDIDSVKSSKTNYQLDEVINCFRTDVWDYGLINMAQNIYSVDFNEVTRVFVDSPDIQEVKTIEKKLLNHGFVSVDKNYNIPIFNTIMDSVSRSKHEQFLVTASISVFIIYLFMSFVFSKKYIKHIQVSRIVGGEFKIMVKLTLVTTGIISLIISGLVCLIILYFEFIGVNHLSLVNFLKIQVFMLLCNLILASVNLYISYKHTENLTRRLYYG